MRGIKYNLAILTTAALIGFSSCEKGFLEGINDDPNNPTAVSPNLLLPTAQVATASVYGNDYARYSDIFVQHQAGTDRQFSAIGVYTLLESDVDNIWRFNAYGGGMFDLNELIVTGTADGNLAYVGIAQVLMAANLGVLTDAFGDIPYSTAFAGAEVTKPTYDSGDQIYTSIFQLLSNAQSNLDAVSVLSPSSDDLIFGGDIASWKAAARSLEARYRLHLGLLDPTNYAAALSALDAGAIVTGGDMQVPFGDLVTENNPWFQFYEQRDGYLSMGKFFIDLLNATGDPRLPVYATVNDAAVYNGANPGDAFSNEFSLLGSSFASTNSPVPLITYAETKFIEAEAAFRTGDLPRAASAHNEAVLGSLAYNGVSDAVFEAANATETAGSITIEKILTQKYVALLTQFESWTDYRRTGIPAIIPADGSADVPVRFPYPQSERLYNEENVPSGVTINTNLWWDID